MTIKLKAPVRKALKEALRVVLIAVIPVFITSVQANKVDLKTIGVVAFIALLRFVDKLLHEEAKVEPKKTRNEGYLGVKGLTGF